MKSDPHTQPPMMPGMSPLARWRKSIALSVGTSGTWHNLQLSGMLLGFLSFTLIA